MPNSIRWLLIFVATAVAAVMAAPEFIDFPGYIKVIIAALAAGFAGVGIYPPRNGGGRNVP